jgi:hypothetical protein
MKILLPILAAASLLAGCNTVQRISYGSWLDHIGERKAARFPLTEDEKQALSKQAVDLHAQADAVRVKLAAEKDRTQRIAYMRRLEDIGDDLRPVEKLLRDGGTSRRREPPPPNYVQGGGV